MNKINIDRMILGALLILFSWFNYVSRGDGCLASGGGRGICGNLAILVMIHATLGGLYLIYRGFKK